MAYVAADRVHRRIRRICPAESPALVAAARRVGGVVGGRVENGAVAVVQAFVPAVDGGNLIPHAKGCEEAALGALRRRDPCHGQGWRTAAGRAPAAPRRLQLGVCCPGHRVSGTEIVGECEGAQLQ